MSFRLPVSILAAVLAGCASARDPAPGDRAAPHELAGRSDAPRGGSGPAAADSVQIPTERGDPSGVPAAGSDADGFDLTTLEIPGHEPATVVVPRSGTQRPLVVALHGAGGRPEPHCLTWAKRTRGNAFVMCTRGNAMNKHLPEPERGYFYDGHPALGKEMLAAIAALEAKHGERVRTRDAIFTGYSQGATMGILFLHESEAAMTHFSRIVLVEGGFEQWTQALVMRLARKGTRKLVLACGQKSCIDAAHRWDKTFARAGLDYRLLLVPGGGHTPEGAVGEAVDGTLDWLFEEAPPAR